MKKFIIPAIIVAVVVVLAVVYFTGKGPEEIPEGSMDQQTTTHSPQPATGGATAPKTTAPVPTTQTGGTVQVDIKGFSFVSQTVRINPGTTIRWKNFDAVNHTVTSDAGLFNSGIIAKDGTFSYKFSNEGTYKYKCSLHPDMTGEIIVRSGSF